MIFVGTWDELMQQLGTFDESGRLHICQSWFNEKRNWNLSYELRAAEGSSTRPRLWNKWFVIAYQSGKFEDCDTLLCNSFILKSLILKQAIALIKPFLVEQAQAILLNALQYRKTV